MKYVFLFLFSLSANAGMFYSKAFVMDPKERPGAYNFLDKRECERHYNGDCVEIPDNYDPNFHDYNEIAGFRVNAQKKNSYDAKINQEKAEREAAKVEKERLKNKIKSGQQLSIEESNNLLLLLIDK